MKKGKRERKNKESIIGIFCVLLLLVIVLAGASISLKSKNQELKTQQKGIEEQMAEEEEKKEELDEMEEYVGTDEYTEEVAKDKLGLVKEGEILFEAEP